MIIVVRSAIPNPSISNELLIRLSVSIRVMALITKRNKPKVSKVTGRVKMIRIGRTSTFKIESRKLAPNAAPKLET